MIDWSRRITPVLLCGLFVCTPVGVFAAEADAPESSNIDSPDVDIPSVNHQWALANSQTPLLQLLTAEKLHDQSSSPESLLLKGVALTRLSRLDEAESLFLSLSEKHPHWSEPLNNLGVIYSSQGKWQQAIDVLQKAINTNSGTAKAYANIREIFDYRAALAYRKALDASESIAQPELKLHIRLPEKRSRATSRVGVPASVNSEAIRKQLNYWLAAWENGQVNEYLSVYADTFLPEKGGTLDEWKASRSTRLKRSRKIQISYESLDVFMSDTQERAFARFVQHYVSNNYRDKVLKELVFTRQDGSWLIESEKVLKSYNDS